MEFEMKWDCDGTNGIGCGGVVVGMGLRQQPAVWKVGAVGAVLDMYVPGTYACPTPALLCKRVLAVGKKTGQRSEGHAAL